MPDILPANESITIDEERTVECGVLEFIVTSPSPEHFEFRIGTELERKSGSPPHQCPLQLLWSFKADTDDSQTSLLKYRAPADECLNLFNAMQTGTSEIEQEDQWLSTIV